VVKSNVGRSQLRPNWEKDCKFPLVTDKPPGAIVSFWSLPGISDEAFTFIKKIQPYNKGKVNDALRVLAQLANIDKHRHLHVVNPKAFGKGWGQNVLFPFLSFDEKVLGEEMAFERVEEVLRLCTSRVRTFIVPEFEKLIENR